MTFWNIVRARRYVKEVASVSWRGCGKNGVELKKAMIGPAGKVDNFKKRLDQLWGIGGARRH